ncbi:MAG TPA: hypothetical protein PKY56_12265 [Candidatus Kapabacteria bacterium]|nr:hypothetical protein [Candidatus Kapabacteria bacterium]
MKKLEGLEKVTEFIKIVVASNFIEGVPLSLLIIAPVSSGKTTAIKQFQINKNILITTDTTKQGILSKYQEKLRNSEIKCIIVPDLLNVLAKRETSVKDFLTFVNASSEDGIFPSKTYVLNVEQYIPPFSWILCLTDEGFKSKHKYLKGIGFLSRFFVVKWKYTPEQIEKILQNIINEEFFKIPDVVLKCKKKKVKIEKNIKVFEELVTYSKLLSASESEAIRLQRKFQTFLKSCAYLRGARKVEAQDLEKLKNLIELIK